MTSPELALIVALVAVAVGVGAGAWAFWLWRRRKLRKKVAKLAPRLRHPVVLAHGLLGFDQLKMGPVSNAYFRGVEPRLTKLGAKVYAFRVSSTGSIATRAEGLAKAVRALDSEKVNIVAHSMGGLDARYLASRMQMAPRIASITTIGTPHRGTPLADLGTGLWGVAPTARKLLERMGLDVNGFFDLTTDKMARFNAAVPDAKGVFYGSWTARAPGGVSLMNPLLLPTWKLISARAGENDGLVPLASQQWGEVFGCVEADHWAQIGWSLTFDAPSFYEQLVQELMKRGF